MKNHTRTGGETISKTGLRLDVRGRRLVQATWFPAWLQVMVVAFLMAHAGPVSAGSGAPPEDRNVRIVLVGDSTVTDKSGWGYGFKQFLTDRVECTNTAANGRSSRSFIHEGRWEKALALKGDYYLIQFGHNDEPGKGPDRETDPHTSYHDFMARYVDDTRAIGAKPILVTSLTRRMFDKSGIGKIVCSLTPYVEEVRKLASEKHVPLVDLYARSIELCEQLGPEACLAFSPTRTTNQLSKAAGTNRVDNPAANQWDYTHLNATGSVVFAGLVVKELRRAVPELAAYLRDKPAVAVRQFQPSAEVVVDADGTGQFTTVQAAIDAAPTNRVEPFVVVIKPGTYKEHLFIPADKPHLTFRGEDAATTILTDDHNFNTIDTTGQKLVATNSCTVLIRAADFRAENITFENTTPLASHVQALALYVTGDRAVFRRCRFLGWQDTLRADAPRGEIARQYFADCEIVGHVDFIYAAGTAVFDRCHIHCLADGYITAASTPQQTPFGYVFLDCHITAAPEVQHAYLGRPWRPFAAVAFLRTAIPAEIRPEGWNNWRNPTNETTARFAEYQSTGPGARPEARVKWARQLSDEEAKSYTTENVLRGADGWNPNVR
jgi:pectinesterase